MCPPAGAPSGLSVTTGQRGKNKRAELAWTGGGATLDVKLDDSIIATVANSGSYTHNVGKNPSGTYTYQVCNAGTAECTLTKSVSF